MKLIATTVLAVALAACATTPTATGATLLLAKETPPALLAIAL